MKKKSPTKNLKEAIVDLYLNVKVRSQEEISKFNERKYESEKSVLLDKDPLLILEYIKSSIEIIMNIKAEDACPASSQGEITPREPPKDYELIIQKLEAEVRSHIRVEQQLKLHIEGLQSKYEELLKQHDIQLKLLQENAQKLGAEKVQKEAELKSARDTIRELSNKLSHPLARLQENEVKLKSLKISGTESSKTAQNISTEEHLKNFPPDIGQLAKSGEMAKRNAATTLCKNWKAPGAPHLTYAVRRPSEGCQTWGKTGTGKKARGNEQNIIQIICKSPPHCSKCASAELIEEYKKEIERLKLRLQECKRTNHPPKLTGSLSTAILTSYQRSNSHKSICSNEKTVQYGKKAQDFSTKYSSNHPLAEKHHSSVYHDRDLSTAKKYESCPQGRRARPATSVPRSRPGANSQSVLKVVESKLELITSQKTLKSTKNSLNIFWGFGVLGFWGFGVLGRAIVIDKFTASEPELKKTLAPSSNPIIRCNSTDNFSDLSFLNR